MSEIATGSASVVSEGEMNFWLLFVSLATVILCTGYAFFPGSFVNMNLYISAGLFLFEGVMVHTKLNSLYKTLFKENEWQSGMKSKILKDEMAKCVSISNFIMIITAIIVSGHFLHLLFGFFGLEVNWLPKVFISFGVIINLIFYYLLFYPLLNRARS